jgi:hypothetical protein
MADRIGRLVSTFVQADQASFACGFAPVGRPAAAGLRKRLELLCCG